MTWIRCYSLGGFSSGFFVVAFLANTSPLVQENWVGEGYCGVRPQMPDLHSPKMVRGMPTCEWQFPWGGVRWGSGGPLIPGQTAPQGWVGGRLFHLWWGSLRRLRPTEQVDVGGMAIAVARAVCYGTDLWGFAAELRASQAGVHLPPSRLACQLFVPPLHLEL